MVKAELAYDSQTSIVDYRNIDQNQWRNTDFFTVIGAGSIKSTGDTGVTGVQWLLGELGILVVQGELGLVGISGIHEV